MELQCSGQPWDSGRRDQLRVDQWSGQHAPDHDLGDNPESVELSFWAVWYREDDPVTVDDGSRHILLGSSEQTAEDIAKMAEIGVRSMVFNFLRPSLSQSLDAMERFAAEVMPNAKA